MQNRFLIFSPSFPHSKRNTFSMLNSLAFRCGRAVSRFVPWRFLPSLFTASVLGGLLNPAAAEKFSIVLLPDPQYYTEYPSHDLYAKQARWIRDNRVALNIKHTLVLGDLTNDNETAQWATADAAFDILDAANMSYAVVPGNHDYRTANGWVGAANRSMTKYNNTVGPSRFSGKSWYGGNFDGSNENNYTYFSAAGLDFLVVGLEYAPRKEVLTWANNVISQHPNHRVIIFTHAYLTVNGNYGSGAASNYGFVGADGADIFEECASRHSNVFLVACGHVTESKVNTKVGNCGNTIYEMLVDYQGEKPLGTGTNLGNGWLRVLEFDTDTNKITGKTITVVSGNSNYFHNGNDRFYHANYSSSPTHVDHLFTLNYDMGPPAEPYTYINSSVEFRDMAVNDIGGGDQIDPDIAQADNGNWAAVWEDDSDNNGIFRIFVRGFDPDGNERFADTVVNTSGVNSVNAVNPAIAMAGDGRFVVVWQSSSTAIKMRIYNASGTPTGSSEVTVASATSPGSVRVPDVAMDDSGNFVVVWEDDADGNGYYQIRARGYSFSGSQRFAAKTVNTEAAGQQRNPVIAMASNGDYVVAWDDDTNNNGYWDVHARGFLANETERFAQFRVNTTYDGQQRDPDVAMDDTGRFVVVWEDDADQNNVYQIKARVFAANGSQLLSERTVNLVASGNQINPAVSMDPSGNWYPVWMDNGVPGGQGYQMMAQVFSITGTRLYSSDLQANSVASVVHHAGNPSRNSPVISAHRSGRYIVAWADDMDGNGGFQILARGIPGTARSLAIKAINGSVSRSPADPFFAPNATVTLTANPDPGYMFIQWQGDVPAGSQTANPLNLVMNGDKYVTAQFGATSAPAAPGNLTATAVSQSQINLTWTDNSNNEANFVVAVGTSPSGPFTDIAILNANTTSYSSTGLSPSTTYYHVVRATNAAGSSANSNAAGATTHSAVPAAPGNLTATAVSKSQINLTWTDNSSNESNMVVARSTTAGGPYTVIATLGANTTSYSSTGLSANTRYYYVVRASNSFGTSADSNEANALTWPADIIIDNSSAGFTASGNWSTGTSAADRYGADYRFRPTAAVSDTAKWSFSVPQSRNYEISAWWSQGTNRSAAAPYILPDSTSVPKNQQTNGGKWNVLATQNLSTGNHQVQLSCWATTGFTVIADAIKVTAK